MSAQGHNIVHNSGEVEFVSGDFVNKSYKLLEENGRKTQLERWTDWYAENPAL